MKSVLITAILVGGVSGAGAAYVLAKPDKDSAGDARAHAVSRFGSLELVALEKAVDELREENRRLREKLELVSAAPAASREPVEGYVSKLEFEAFRKEILAALAQGVEPAAALEGEPVGAFEDKVESALIQIRQQEKFDAVRDYHEKRNARLEEDVEKVADWLEMNAHQVTGMRRALLVQYDREAEQARRWEAGEDPEVLGELKRADGEAFDRDLRTFLSDEQAETFWDRILGRERKDQ